MARTTRVRTGLDRWIDEGAQVAGLAPGARVALLTHAASVDRDARHAVEAVTAPAAADRVRPVRLLAPEHGLWGHEQDMESVGSTVDPGSGLPVVSLYGRDAASLRPSPEALADLDAVVCDVQDVGTRYYTYVYTVAYVMEAARELGLPVVVLDRPNPLGGVALEGPVLDPTLASFVGRYPIPVRHGMTVGELARLFNDCDDVAGIGCDLRVVSMNGWRREMRFEDTGLPWVPPSPNMPTTATALVYPGGCLVEGTNLSEGRGTTLPFELVGAPWLEPRPFAAALRSAELPGVAFRAASFRPEQRKHAGLPCGGVQVIVTDARTFRPFATYLAILREARRLAPDAFDWRREVYEFEADRLAIDLLLGRHELRPMLEADAPIAEIEASWAAGSERFARIREPYLLYP